MGAVRSLPCAALLRQLKDTSPSLLFWLLFWNPVPLCAAELVLGLQDDHIACFRPDFPGDFPAFAEKGPSTLANRSSG